MAEERKHIEEELKKISPSLHDILSKAKLHIPENYFAELESNILSETIHSRNKKTAFSPWYILAVAAVLTCVFFGIKLSGVKCISPQGFDEQIAALSADEINAIIENNIADFDAQLLLESGYIEQELVNDRMHAELQSQLPKEKLSTDAVKEKHEEINLDEAILKQLDDSALQDMLLDESLIDDLGL